MSRHSGRFGAALVLLALSTSTGCWEQMSESWWPQMKWQKAVQAYERVEFQGQIEGFVPPEGTVPVTGQVPSYDRYDAAADGLKNPTNPQDFHSLARGREVYRTNCAVCHGTAGLGDGPVSAIRYPSASYGDSVGEGGPFAGIFPLSTAIARSDGYIYNFVRNGGGRMPSYRRIPDDERWHLVNYVRHLQRGGTP